MRPFLSLAALAVAACSSSAQTAFSQPFTPASIGGAISEGVAGGFFNERQADNFALTSPANIQQVRWWGAEEGFFSVDFPGNIAGFRVEIFQDAAGLPGAPLATETVAIADLETASTGLSFAFGQEVFQFTHTLSTPIALNAATPYWFSVGVIPVAPLGNADSFFWAFTPAGTGDGARAFEDPVFSGFAAEPTPADDMAFELIIPAPGSVALLGLVGLAAGRRRR